MFELWTEWQLGDLVLDSGDLAGEACVGVWGNGIDSSE